MLAAGSVDTRELREAIGRMVFVYGALSWDRPFLAPLFAFLKLHAIGVKVALPLYVKIVIKWLRDRLSVRRGHPVREHRRKLRDAMRVDAKAEGLAVALGGWAPQYREDGSVDTRTSKWFSVRLDENTAPWAFSRGLPARSISTLELLATTVGLVLLAPHGLEEPDVEGTVTVQGLTDSQVSSHVVTRGLTTTYPLCCIAMELAAQLERRGCELPSSGFLGR